MKLEDKYWLLKIQGIVALLCLMVFACWSAFQENGLLYLGIIAICMVIQGIIFFKYWQPTLTEYKKQQKKGKDVEE